MRVTDHHNLMINKTWKASHGHGHNVTLVAHLGMTVRLTRALTVTRTANWVRSLTASWVDGLTDGTAKSPHNSSFKRGLSGHFGN